MFCLRERHVPENGGGLIALLQSEPLAQHAMYGYEHENGATKCLLLESFPAACS